MRGPPSAAAAAAARPEPGVPPSAAARGQSGVGGLGATLPVGLLLLREGVPGVVELGLQPLEGGVLPGLLRPLPGLVVQEERVAVGLGHLGRRGARVDGGKDGEGPDVDDVLAVGLGDRECRDARLGCKKAREPFVTVSINNASISITHYKYGLLNSSFKGN